MLLFIVRSFIAFIWIGISSVLGSLFCLISPKNPRNVYYCGQLLKHTLKILGVKLEVQGLEILKQYKGGIIISNHQSGVDMFVACSIIPKRTVSLGKKSIRFLPFIGQLYWLTGNVLIDRNNKKNAMQTMDDVADAVTQQDINVWIMPEGTRSRKRGLLPFKRGAFIAAIRAQRPVLPVVISSYQKLDFKKWDAGVIKVKVLSPIVPPVEQTIEASNTYREHVYQIFKDEYAMI